MSEDMSQVVSSISDELKYTKKDYSHPKYRFNQLYPISGQQTFVVTSGGNELQFQLPVKVFNLARSVLEMTITPSIPAAGHNVSYKTPLSPIRQIQLFTQGGVYLCDVYNVNKYVNTVYFPETTLPDFLSNEIVDSVTAAASVKSIGTHRSNLINSASAAVMLNANRIPIPANGTIAADPTFVPATCSYTERMYYQTASADTIGNPVLKISFPMKHLYNTIFNIDKDLYFGEVLNLRIIFDHSDSTFYKITAGAAELICPAFADLARLSSITQYTVSNTFFYLAAETDLNIANQIINRVSTAGLSLTIPYVYTYKTNIASGTSQSISLRFNRAHGKKLRKIYHIPCHPTESLVYNYNRDNNDQKMVVSYYTLLNNDRLQEFNITGADYKDWQLIKNKLTGSAIQSVGEYRSSWFIVDDFCTEKPLCSDESHDFTLSSGIDLISEQKWDLYLETTNRDAIGGFVHYNFAITEKDLFIRPGSIIVQ